MTIYQVEPFEFLFASFYFLCVSKREVSDDRCQSLTGLSRPNQINGCGYTNQGGWDHEIHGSKSKLDESVACDMCASSLNLSALFVHLDRSTHPYLYCQCSM